MVTLGTLPRRKLHVNWNGRKKRLTFVVVTTSWRLVVATASNELLPELYCMVTPHLFTTTTPHCLVNTPVAKKSCQAQVIKGSCNKSELRTMYEESKDNLPLYYLVVTRKGLGHRAQWDILLDMSNELLPAGPNLSSACEVLALPAATDTSGLNSIMQFKAPKCQLSDDHDDSYGKAYEHSCVIMNKKGP
ncbi:hypothetical protein MRX96_012793 [Rhipicephalus microplus]